MGFALSIGVQMLVFYVAAKSFGVSKARFVRVFVLAAVASFLVVDLFLYYKVRVADIPDAQMFLAGCVGGWLAGLMSGLTQLRPFLLNLMR
jgi:heme/copper-type cytochrome/quinol oxidase subunit 4